MSISDAFVVGAPVPEAAMIGRIGVVEDLSRRLADINKLSLTEPRRTGKTTVARAAMQRLAKRGFLVGQVDVFTSGNALVTCRDLKRQFAERLSDPQHRAALPSSAQQQLDALLDVNGGAVQPLGELLGAVRAIEGVPRLAVFLDEVHAMAKWGERDQLSLREFLRNDVSVAIVLASSERRMFERLLADGGALEGVSQRYPMDPIRREDWRAGLRARFRRVGTPIDDHALELLLDETKGHPGCTMILAREAAYCGEDVSQVTADIVQVALLRASKDPTWQLLDAD